PEGVLYFADAGWHNDDGIGVRGVKFAAYLDPLSTANGALRLLPGSHHPEQNVRLTDYRSRQGRLEPGVEAVDFQSKYPGYVADTRPGDVIAFDLHTWHASAGGRDRLAWTIVYQGCPKSDDEAERTRRAMTDSFEQAFRGFDSDRYPVWRDWLTDAASHPRRTAVIERLRVAGVLQLPGAQLGW
ncbi:MAG: phytanoyl-CoA dioxygenase family protein, partial [Acidimicrobiales bacterium]